MSRLTPFVVCCLAALAMAGSDPAMAAGSQSDEYRLAAESGEDLSTRELRRIYGAHSWIWKDGAGYFRISKRSFKAFSGNPGPEANYADGLWFLPGSGKLCFRATWNAVSGSSEALTCFAHKIAADGTIYMRRHPDGDWFILSRNPGHAWDEIKKFEPGDQVDKWYRRNKEYVDKNRKQESCLEKRWPPLICKLFGS